MSNITYIYALVDPRTDEVRYIGKSNNPVARLRGHLSEARRMKSNNGRKDKWIKELIDLNLRPLVQILSEVNLCNGGSWEEEEKAAIEKGRKKGWKLLNIASGGCEWLDHWRLKEKAKGENSYQHLKGDKYNKTFKEEHVALLGTMSDYELADLIGLHQATILAHRKKRGIPSFLEQQRIKKQLGMPYKKKKYTPPANPVRVKKEKPPKPPKKKCGVKSAIPFELLGTMPDWELARLYNRSKSQVKHMRASANISPCPYRTTYTWDEYSLSLLGKASDQNVSQRLRVKQSLVTEKRLELDIPNYYTIRPKPKYKKKSEVKSVSS